MKDDGKYYLLLDEVQRFFVMILSFYSNFFFHQHFLILHSNTIGRYIGRDLVSAILLALIHERVRSFNHSFKCVLRP